MWISKKKWEEMCDRVDVTSSNLTKTIKMVTELEEKIRDYESHKKKIEKLLDAHCCNYSEGFQETRGGKSTRYYSRILKEINHNNLNTSTNLIPNVTLEELAKLVIDGTPIKRTEKIDMTTEFHGRV